MEKSALDLPIAAEFVLCAFDGWPDECRGPHLKEAIEALGRSVKRHKSGRASSGMELRAEAAIDAAKTIIGPMFVAGETDAAIFSILEAVVISTIVTIEAVSGRSRSSTAAAFDLLTNRVLEKLTSIPEGGGQ